MTNCPNCGAPIDITADKCVYCDTYYEKVAEPDSKKTFDEIIRGIRMGYLTVNEARMFMGLQAIEDPDFRTKQISIPTMESD